MGLNPRRGVIQDGGGGAFGVGSVWSSTVQGHRLLNVLGGRDDGQKNYTH